MLIKLDYFTNMMVKEMVAQTEHTTKMLMESGDDIVAFKAKIVAQKMKELDELVKFRGDLEAEGYGK